MSSLSVFHQRNFARREWRRGNQGSHVTLNFGCSGVVRIVVHGPTRSTLVWLSKKFYGPKSGALILVDLRHRHEGQECADSASKRFRGSELDEGDGQEAAASGEDRCGAKSRTCYAISSTQPTHNSIQCLGDVKQCSKAVCSSDKGKYS